MHEEKDAQEGNAGKAEKGNEGGDDFEQQTGAMLESAGKYLRTCLLLLKGKYKNENPVFMESKHEVKVEKNERKASSEETKEVEVNKFSEKFEK